MTTLGAHPAKGPSMQWERITDLSPETSAFLHGKFRLWWRRYDMQYQFVVLPIGQRPNDDTLSSPSIHEALCAAGQH